MMKVSILTLGSLGDVQPYVALGKALIQKGHHVCICTGNSFRLFVESNKIAFYPAHVDFMEILATPEGKAIFNGNPIKSYGYIKNFLYPAFRKTFDDFYEASKNADMIICHPKAMVAPDIADALGIPCIHMPPVPILYPTTEFPCIAVTAKKNFGSKLNKLSYRAINYSESPYLKDINDFREKTLHLTKRKTGTYSNFDNQPIIYPMSPSLFSDVKSWKGHVLLSGFLYLELDQTKVDSEITHFLESGEAPWIVSFSSMPLKNPSKFSKDLITVLEYRKERAIVIVGNSGLIFDSPLILAVNKVPHRLIFPLGKGIVHHGGIGTTAEALLSGRPQHIIPFNVDQPFWANRLFKLGLMAQAFTEKNISFQNLNDMFDNMLKPKSQNSALMIQKKIMNEDGIQTTIAYLETITS